MVFCEIDNALLEIIHDHANGRKVIDLGAGECLFEALYRVAYPTAQVLSVEPFPQEHYYINKMDVTRFLAQHMPFETRDLPIFIRPCHSFEFAPAALMNMLTQVSEALYVSNPKNIEFDIPKGLAYKRLGDWQGKDGEQIFVILLGGEKYVPSEQEFYMVKLPHWKEPIRMEKIIRDNKEWYVNTRGGGFPIRDGEIESAVKI